MNLLNSQIYSLEKVVLSVKTRTIDQSRESEISKLIEEVKNIYIAIL
jgi:hypothetical protein